MTCPNHPEADVRRHCARCGAALCDSCLVEFLGRSLCGPCRDASLAKMQAPDEAPFAGTGRVDLPRWLTRGCTILRSAPVAFGWAGFVNVALTFLSCSILDPALQCGLLIMGYRGVAGQRVEANGIYDGFRRFWWAFLAGMVIRLCLMGLAFLVNEAFFALAAETAAEGAWLTALDVGLAVVRSILLAFLLGAVFFVLPHVAAWNSSPVAALRASWSVTRRNLPMFAVMGFLCSPVPVANILLQFTSMSARLIGPLVEFLMVPFASAATAQAYADHFGAGSWDEVVCGRGTDTGSSAGDRTARPPGVSDGKSGA